MDYSDEPNVIIRVFVRENQESENQKRRCDNGSQSDVAMSQETQGAPRNWKRQGGRFFAKEHSSVDTMV